MAVNSRLTRLERTFAVLRPLGLVVPRHHRIPMLEIRREIRPSGQQVGIHNLKPVLAETSPMLEIPLTPYGFFSVDSSSYLQ